MKKKINRLSKAFNSIKKVLYFYINLKNGQNCLKIFKLNTEIFHIKFVEHLKH